MHAVAAPSHPADSSVYSQTHIHIHCKCASLCIDPMNRKPAVPEWTIGWSEDAHHPCDDERKTGRISLLMACHLWVNIAVCLKNWSLCMCMWLICLNQTPQMADRCEWRSVCIHIDAVFVSLVTRQFCVLLQIRREETGIIAWHLFTVIGSRGSYAALFWIRIWRIIIKGYIYLYKGLMVK